MSPDTPASEVELANQVQIEERKGFSFPFIVGPVAIILNVVLVLAAIATGLQVLSGFFNGEWIAPALLTVLFITLVVAIGSSILIQSPGQATVLEFFGDYLGTIRKTGLVVTLPFLTKYHMSVKAENFETPVSKVNDANGNPINISSIIVWQLKDTAKATYAVEEYDAYLKTQAEAAVRHVAANHPYDSTEEGKTSLLRDADIVNAELAQEVGLRAAAAGIEIIEVRINNLSYSVEIAQAMLQRQQAGAIIAARQTIVDGAVGIVESAAEKLAEKHSMSEEKKAELVANLLVVLVSESKVSPVMNVGKQ